MGALINHNSVAARIMHEVVGISGSLRYKTNVYITGGIVEVGTDIILFKRGLCLPSDNKMTVDEQVAVIEIVRSCF